MNECRRESAQVVQHRRAQFPGEPMHDVHRFFHEPLRAGDFFLEALVVERGLGFKEASRILMPVKSGLFDHAVRG